MTPVFNLTDGFFICDSVRFELPAALDISIPRTFSGMFAVEPNDTIESFELPH